MPFEWHAGDRCVCAHRLKYKSGIVVASGTRGHVMNVQHSSPPPKTRLGILWDACSTHDPAAALLMDKPIDTEPWRVMPVPEDD